MQVAAGISSQHGSVRASSHSMHSSGRSLSIRKGWVKRFQQLPRTILRSCETKTPLFVPAEQPLELFFFQRIFDHLCETQKERSIGPGGWSSQEDPASQASKEGKNSVHVSTSEFESPPTQDVCEVPLVQFHRAMVRLFRILKQPMESPDDGALSVTNNIDANSNGKVGWYEFCSFWQEKHISIKLSLPERIFLTLEDPSRSLCGRLMSTIVLLAIMISTVCFILSTTPGFKSVCILEGEPGFDPDCRPTPDQFFKDADLGCVIFFSIEYGLRLLFSGVMRTELVDRDRQQLLEWMVTEDTIRHPTFMMRVSAWFLHPANLIDLAAIMPWFLSKAAEASGSNDNILIKLIRLARVVRAIRLGKRFEAVIIVGKSVRRSIRALYVLVLNLTLGVIISGSLMFFFEQGTWNTERKAYERNHGQDWDNANKEWIDVKERSPFESIPACFWWAIVTTTTAGYGDMYPTSLQGKIIATISMIWSLCVLALPIGVIGNNFSNVWSEFDAEKDRQKWNARKEQVMLKRSKAWGEPLHHSRRIVLEVWHDPGIKSGDGEEASMDQAEFMGEIDCTLEMPEREEKQQRVTLPLCDNEDKARRRVRGAITFEYDWKPANIKGTEGVLLAGILKVKIISAEDLIAVDWKGGCESDPYCMLWAWPQSPSEGRHLEPQMRKTPTQWNTSCPEFNETVEFQVHWSKDGTDRCMRADMKQIGISDTNLIAAQQPVAGSIPRPSRTSLNVTATQTLSEPTDEEKKAALMKWVPELQDELRCLQRVEVPDIRRQISDVKKDLQAIVAALETRSKRPLGATSAGTPLASAAVSSSQPAASGSRVAGDLKQQSTSVSAQSAGASPWTALPHESDD